MSFRAGGAVFVQVLTMFKFDAVCFKQTPSISPGNPQVPRGVGAGSGLRRPPPRSLAVRGTVLEVPALSIRRVRVQGGRQRVLLTQVPRGRLATVKYHPVRSTGSGNGYQPDRSSALDTSRAPRMPAAPGVHTWPSTARCLRLRRARDSSFRRHWIRRCITCV